MAAYPKTYKEICFVGCDNVIVLIIFTITSAKLCCFALFFRLPKYIFPAFRVYCRGPELMVCASWGG